MGKKILLVIMWIACIITIAFFSDIIINYLIGNTKSPITDACTKGHQCYISCVMVTLCVNLIGTYTLLARDNKK